MRGNQGVWVTATGLVSAGHAAAGLKVCDGRLGINSRLQVALGTAEHGSAVDVGHACWAQLCQPSNHGASRATTRTCAPRRLTPQAHIVVVVARLRLVAHIELQVAEHRLLALSLCHVLRLRQQDGAARLRVVQRAQQPGRKLLARQPLDRRAHGGNHLALAAIQVQAACVRVQRRGELLQRSLRGAQAEPRLVPFRHQRAGALRVLHSQLVPPCFQVGKRAVAKQLFVALAGGAQRDAGCVPAVQRVRYAQSQQAWRYGARRDAPVRREPKVAVAHRLVRLRLDVRRLHGAAARRRSARAHA